MELAGRFLSLTILIRATNNWTHSWVFRYRSTGWVLSSADVWPPSSTSSFSTRTEAPSGARDPSTEVDIVPIGSFNFRFKTDSAIIPNFANQHFPIQSNELLIVGWMDRGPDFILEFVEFCRFFEHPQRRGQLRRHQVDGAQLPERPVAALRSVPGRHDDRPESRTEFRHPLAEPRLAQ